MKCGSRGLAYLNIAYYVSWLNCWVRNGSRCVPTESRLVISRFPREFHWEISANTLLKNWSRGIPRPLIQSAAAFRGRTGSACWDLGFAPPPEVADACHLPTLHGNRAGEKYPGILEPEQMYYDGSKDSIDMKSSS